MTDDTMLQLRAANPVAAELTEGERRDAQLLLQRVLDAPGDDRGPHDRPHHVAAGARSRSAAALPCSPSVCSSQSRRSTTVRASQSARTARSPSPTSSTSSSAAV